MHFNYLFLLCFFTLCLVAGITEDKLARLFFASLEIKESKCVINGVPHSIHSYAQSTITFIIRVDLDVYKPHNMLLIKNRIEAGFFYNKKYCLPLITNI